jgi:hypothetical protein
VHLQGAVTPAQGNTPVAIAEKLNLVMPGLLDIELDEDVFIVSDPAGLDLVEDLEYQSRSIRRRPGNIGFRGVVLGEQRRAEDTLSLTPPRRR